MEDLLVDKEKWIIVHSLLVHNLLIHKLLVLNLLVCRKKIGRIWIEEQGVQFDSA
jgi:hypothetical protein